MKLNFMIILALTFLGVNYSHAGGVNGGGGFLTTGIAIQTDRILGVTIDVLKKTNSWVPSTNWKILYPQADYKPAASLKLVQLLQLSIESYTIDPELVVNNKLVIHDNLTNKFIFTKLYMQTGTKAAALEILKEMFAEFLANQSEYSASNKYEVANYLRVIVLDRIFSQHEDSKSLGQYKPSNCGLFGSLKERIRSCEMAGLGPKSPRFKLVEKFMYMDISQNVLFFSDSYDPEDINFLRNKDPKEYRCQHQGIEKFGKAFRLATPNEIRNLILAFNQSTFFTKRNVDEFYPDTRVVYATSDHDLFLSAKDGKPVQIEEIKYPQFMRVRDICIMDLDGDFKL